MGLTFPGGGLVPSSAPTMAMRTLRDGAQPPKLTDGSQALRPSRRSPMQSAAETVPLDEKTVVKSPYKSMLVFSFLQPKRQNTARERPFSLISGPFRNTRNLPRSSGREIYSSVLLTLQVQMRIKMYYLFVGFFFLCGEQTDYERGSENPSKSVHIGISTLRKQRLWGKNNLLGFQLFICFSQTTPD